MTLPLILILATACTYLAVAVFIAAKYDNSVYAASPWWALARPAVAGDRRGWGAGGVGVAAGAAREADQRMAGTESEAIVTTTKLTIPDDGEGYALIIPDEFVTQLGWGDGEEVIVSVSEGRITLHSKRDAVEGYQRNGFIYPFCACTVSLCWIVSAPLFIRMAWPLFICIGVIAALVWTVAFTDE